MSNVSSCHQSIACLRICQKSEIKNKETYKYGETYLKRPLKKKTKKWFSRPIITQCRSKVLQNALFEHSAILSTFIKLQFVFKTFVLSFLIGPLKTGFTVR